MGINQSNCFFICNNENNNKENELVKNNINHVVYLFNNSIEI